MIIDVQHHWTVWDHYNQRYAFEPLELRIKEMDHFGIDKAALTNFRPDDPSDTKEYEMLNGKLKEAVTSYPDRFIPLPLIPLSDCRSGLRILEDSISKLSPTGIFVRPHKGRIESEEV